MRNEQDSQSRDELFARFYDAEYRDFDDDLSFYAQYATALDPERALPVLELGCGTGRVLVALAEAGFNVTGVDSSAGMLSRAAARAHERSLADRVTTVQDDMRTLQNLEGRGFNLAFCALNSFAYLEETADQRAMLEAVRARLVQHGILIVDLTPPVAALLPPGEGEVVYQGTYPLSDGKGALLHKYVAGYANPSQQAHDVRLVYETEAPDGEVRRYTRSDRLRWTGRYEMELLLELAGYEVEQVLGDYDLEPFDDESPRMIFVART